MTRYDETEPVPSPGEIDRYLAYEKLLAGAIKEFMAEFCLVDANVVIHYVCKGLHGNIADLVNSSNELLRKEGTLVYAHSSDVTFEWGGSPRISLAFEFVHDAVSIFFDLVFDGNYAGVSIKQVLVNAPPEDGRSHLNIVSAALEGARLPPPAGALRVNNECRSSRDRPTFR